MKLKHVCLALLLGLATLGGNSALAADDGPLPKEKSGTPVVSKSINFNNEAWKAISLASGRTLNRVNLTDEANRQEFLKIMSSPAKFPRYAGPEVGLEALGKSGNTVAWFINTEDEAGLGLVALTRNAIKELQMTLCFEAEKDPGISQKMFDDVLRSLALTATGLGQDLKFNLSVQNTYMYMGKIAAQQSAALVDMGDEAILMSMSTGQLMNWHKALDENAAKLKRAREIFSKAKYESFNVSGPVANRIDTSGDLAKQYLAGGLFKKLVDARAAVFHAGLGKTMLKIGEKYRIKPEQIANYLVNVSMPSSRAFLFDWIFPGESKFGKAFSVSFGFRPDMEADINGVREKGDKKLYLGYYSGVAPYEFFANYKLAEAFPETFFEVMDANPEDFKDMGFYAVFEKRFEIVLRLPPFKNWMKRWFETMHGGKPCVVARLTRATDKAVPEEVALSEADLAKGFKAILSSPNYTDAEKAGLSMLLKRGKAKSPGK